MLALVNKDKFNDTALSKKLIDKLEQYKRVTRQLIRDYGIKESEIQYFKNYANYILRQGSINEQDDFIRGLQTILYVQDRRILLRVE